MFLPLLLAAAVSAASSDAGNSDQSTTSPAPRKVMHVRIPMPSFITPDEQLRFDIPYQIPELNWNMQRFWEPYQKSRGQGKDWFHSDYATMNWFGLRDTLANHGLDISVSYTADLAGNPVGGKSAGFTYCDNFTLDLEFQSKPLFGYDGGTLSVIGIERNGNNLSAQHVGNQFTVQQVYGGTGFIFYGLAYNQRFCDDRFSFKFGRMAAGDEFASSPLYWLYMNNGIDGNPQSLPVNGKFTTYPWAVWGSRLRALVTKETELMLGLYQVTPQVSQSYMHGFNWDMNPGDGVMVIGQYGWAHEFFKPATPAPTTSAKSTDGKSVAAANGKDAKTFATPASDAIPHGLPGHYWMGGYYSTWTYPQFGSSQRQNGAYGLYWHFDQMLYRLNPFKDTGLTAWSAFMLCPQQNTAKVPFQYNGGLVYTGMIPFRPQDVSIFGVAYGNFSSNYAQANQATAGGYATYELAYEFGYRINLTKFAYIQPDAQWIINPGGTGTIPNALVLGAQIGVTF
ncbi:MAG: carbohydrate porin [Verrucomicrobia bacterium]|nr:carbohydrate porin [Verrucomicrobiota bacterium]